MSADPWLVVVDLQRVFADPASAWHAGGYAAIVPTVDRLVAEHAGRVVFTRFVRDPTEPGAWADYYDQWPQFRLPPADPVWDLTPTVPAGAPVVDEPTFSKWGPALRAVVGQAPLVVCGVATECCVLGTVLAAADAGRRVTVVADGCAGGTVELHEQALRLMSANAPLVTVRNNSDQR